MSAFQRTYGTGTGADIIVPIMKAGSRDFALAADWTPAAGDVKISKDNGANANIATLPTSTVDRQWKFVFSDAELQAKFIVVIVHDAAVEDQAILIETKDHASAMHPNDLTTAAAATVNAQVDAAIETYHLDHLLAATYDPASKPGAADALLNEMVENDAGVSRFTANALEQGPGGGATAAAIADAVWDEAKSGHVAAGSFGEEVQAHALSTEVAALNDPTAAAIADAVAAMVIEGAVTLKQSLQLSNAAAAGKLSGAAGAAIAIRDLGDTKDRITATVDAVGNRSAVTPSYD